MFVDFDNLGMLPLDMDDELRPRAPPSASSSQDSREDFEIVAERCDDDAPNGLDATDTRLWCWSSRSCRSARDTCAVVPTATGAMLAGRTCVLGCVWAAAGLSGGAAATLGGDEAKKASVAVRCIQTAGCRQKPLTRD